MDGLVAAAVSLPLALAATPGAAAVARRTGLVDRPGPLKVHRIPVPYLGGAAVLIALGVPVASHRPALLVPLVAACALGIADDAREVPPRVRLACELAIGVAAGLVAPAAGPPEAAGVLVTAVVAVGLINAVNLLDGLDGLAAGVSLASALGLAAIGGGARTPALALAGALAGFLVYNRPPARIYLGDGGAYLIGVSLALCCVLALDGNSGSAWLAAPLMVAVPAADTAIAIGRRVRSGAPLFAGDRSHVYDQLVDRGMTAPRTVLVLVAIQAIAGGAGVAIGAIPVAAAVAAAAACTAAMAAATVRGRFLTPATPESSP